MLALPTEKLPQTLTSSYGEDEQSIPESYVRQVCDMFGQLGLVSKSPVQIMGTLLFNVPFLLDLSYPLLSFLCLFETCQKHTCVVTLLCSNPSCLLSRIRNFGPMILIWDF